VPEPVHPLLVQRPVFPPEPAGRFPLKAADVFGRNFPETMLLLGFFDVDNLAGMSPSGALSTHQLVGEPHCYGFRRSLSANSFSMAFSNLSTVRNFFRRVFPFQYWVNHLATSTAMPP